MGWEQVFGLANMAAMLGWVVLIAAPRRVWWLAVLPRMVIPMGLAVVYSGLMLGYFVQSGGGFGSIVQVRTLFASDPVLVGGWVHYLAFDLLIGCFVAERLDRVGIHRIIQAPVLFLVFMFGPMGMLLGLLTEAAATWRGTTSVKLGA